MQKTCAFIHNKCNENSIEITEFYLPVGKLAMGNHSCNQRNDNTKKRDHYRTDTNIVDGIPAADQLRRDKILLRPPVYRFFHLLCLHVKFIN